MFLFRRRKDKKKLEAEREAKIQAIRKDTFVKIDQATKSMKKLNKLLESDDDITLKIYLATGGDRRK